MDKQALIALLRSGDYVSGAELGVRLGVTRAAVSKAVAALKREGWQIDSVPNRGHRLAAEPDRLDRAALLAALGDHPWAGTLELLETVDSTNNLLKTKGAAGAPGGTVAYGAPPRFSFSHSSRHVRASISTLSRSSAGISSSIDMRFAAPSR